MNQADLLAYYCRRAPEYERVYEKPERQADIAVLAGALRNRMAGRDVLEVACGTGYWTEWYVSAARSVLATDASAEMLAVALRRPYPSSRVHFALADAYALGVSAAVASGAPFTAAVGAFWWSHVPRIRLGGFLTALHALLVPGAAVCFCDNRYVAGSSTPISHADDAGNTYQRRRLADGSEHAVLKNFPEPEELRAWVASVASEVEVIELDHFWILSYVLHRHHGQRTTNHGPLP